VQKNHVFELWSRRDCVIVSDCGVFIFDAVFLVVRERDVEGFLFFVFCKI